MLEVVQNRVGLLKETAEYLVARIITSNLICQAYYNAVPVSIPLWLEQEGISLDGMR